MNAVDRKFIEDFYIDKKLNKREVMERYNILNPNCIMPRHPFPPLKLISSFLLIFSPMVLL